MEKYNFIQRKSIRKYKNKDISAEMLENILEQAMRAPTCGNMQLYSVVVTRSEEGKAALAPAHFNQPMVTSAPVVLTVCADFYRFSKWCALSNATPEYDNFISFISAMSDATIFAQQICTIAESLGLGTCYLGTVTYNAPEIAEALHLPDLCVPVACITMGWPDEEGVATERLPLRAVVHEEVYRNDSDEEIISLFKAKDDYEPNHKFVIENKKQSLAQVFTDIRYTGAANREFSRKLIEYLSSRHFM